ncbi:MAG: bifunctional precorrin-2 dehydrogenase/sirohydrochlorin ferrochelatase [Deltaproteobacteria bacterium]|nr:bifunctional precorrin-2 dehydrogenase/sirohydrochlorin ferrochelatase [Deltaproteobacteria bacterium]
MKYYPVNLNMTNKRCVVVGGGDIAERKVERLLECGAQVTVVSKSLTPLLKARKKTGQMDHIDRDYEDQALDGAFMVIGATDQNDVNERISKDAMARGLLVNIVDDPDRCNFILPSLVQQGDLSIAVSTGGKSPALAKKLRKELEKQYGPEYQTLLVIMGILRKRILAGDQRAADNKAVFEDLVHSDILQAIREKDRGRVNTIIHDLTGISMDVRI